MSLTTELLPSDSPLVEAVWRARSTGAVPFTSQAINHWEIVIWRHRGATRVTVRGPETVATPAASHDDAEYLGIQFRLGTFLPRYPAAERVDGELLLPDAGERAVWLDGSALHIPRFEADEATGFVERLVRRGALERDPVVAAVARGEPTDLSQRTLRRRFVHAVGVAPKTFQQTARARAAAKLLGAGVPIADVVFRTGFADQPHLTRSLRRLLGTTPGALAHAAATDAARTTPTEARASEPPSPGTDDAAVRFLQDDERRGGAS